MPKDAINNCLGCLYNILKEDALFHKSGSDDRSIFIDLDSITCFDPKHALFSQKYTLGSKCYSTFESSNIPMNPDYEIMKEWIKRLRDTKIENGRNFGKENLEKS